MALTALRLPAPLADACAVGFGSALGALLRAALTALPASWPLLLVNLAGSLAMGRAQPGLFWGRGFLGGFTSFSAFIAAGTLLAGHQPVLAAGYVLATALGCPAAWLLGNAWRRRAA